MVTTFDKANVASVVAAFVGVLTSLGMPDVAASGLGAFVAWLVTYYWPNARAR